VDYRQKIKKDFKKMVFEPGKLRQRYFCHRPDGAFQEQRNTVPIKKFKIKPYIKASKDSQEFF